MTRPHAVPADYRGRDKMTLVELIEDVEKVHFRTPYDTGANPNAMMVWNIIRDQAGLEDLTINDLIEKYYCGEQGLSWDEAQVKHKEHKDWYRNYQDQQTYNRLKRKFDK